MSDDQTVRRPSHPEEDADRTVAVRRPLALQVTLREPDGKAAAVYSFHGGFTAGRALDNAVVIHHDLVSRHHLEVTWDGTAWWACNLRSTHGIYVHDQAVADRVRLQFPAVIVLGGAGFALEIHQEGSGGPPPIIAPQPHPIANPPPEAASCTGNLPPAHHTALSAEQIKHKLLVAEDSADMGDYTRLVRRVMREEQTKRTRGYRKVIWGLAVLVAVCAGLAGYQHYALAKARTLAMNMFYDIKTLEVSLAQADIRLEESAEALAKTMQALTSERMREEQERIRAEQIKIAEEKKRLARERQKLKLMTAKYEEYVEQVNLLRLSFPTAAEYEKDLIVRVVRGFGESELELPADFIAEVRKYIGYWQATGRMQLAIRNLEDNRYGPIVVDALRQEGMPLYFLYLPLQESNYDSRAVGPETRYGIAKGAWQFLASTGQDYGLTPGPLAATRDYDEQDARFDFNRSSVAGAKHLKFIYGTLSQASGLLTIASYNYGQNKVRSLVESMPDNPRERNFWKFLKGYEVPKETYDYVFYIISAAVIGEDPGHFGYKFRPPLFLAAELKPAA